MGKTTLRRRDTVCCGRDGSGPPAGPRAECDIRFTRSAPAHQPGRLRTPLLGREESEEDVSRIQGRWCLKGEMNGSVSIETDAPGQRVRDEEIHRRHAGERVVSRWF